MEPTEKSGLPSYGTVDTSPIPGPSTARGGAGIGAGDSEFPRISLAQPPPLRAVFHAPAGAGAARQPRPRMLPYRPVPGEGRFYMIPKVKLRFWTGNREGTPEIDSIGDVWITAKRIVFVQQMEEAGQPPASHAAGTVLAHIALENIDNESFGNVHKKSSRLAVQFEISSNKPGSGFYSFEQAHQYDGRALSLTKFFTTLLDNLFLHRFKPFYVRSASGGVFVRQAFVDPDTFKVAYFDVPFNARHFAYAGIESGHLHLAREAPPADQPAAQRPDAAAPADRPGFVAALQASDQGRLESNMRALREAFIRHSRPDTLRSSRSRPRWPAG